MTESSMSFVTLISLELSLTEKQVKSTLALLDDGCTVPFISRYRKEATGSLDEVQITRIRDRHQQLCELSARKQSIVKSLLERDLLSKELNACIDAACTMTELEDIYLPFKPKRRTKGMIAKEKGLEPLATYIYLQTMDSDPNTYAMKYVHEDKGVLNIDDAISGAKDIIAEWVNENKDAREKLRSLFLNSSTVTSTVWKGKESDDSKYSDYFDYTEALSHAAGHRLFALFRGEKEGILKVNIRPSDDDAIALLESMFVKSTHRASAIVMDAVHDAYRRLLIYSMETDIRKQVKERIDLEAISVFGENLRQVLMAAPLGQKSMMAIDPGFRTGCKVVCLSPQGQLLEFVTVHITMSDRQKEQGAQMISDLCTKYNIEAIAIGNGTASRETEAVVRSLPICKKCTIVLVNESGASIYSASKLARDEFPDQDVTVRGSISIGRRLMDPLAELVKIDPKSIGVGQYQHDVDQTRLKNALDDTVMHCVNTVGVEVNTASSQLLSYVSGLGPILAKNIEKYRNEHGPFFTKAALKKVTRLGEKAFEQSAGFIRIHNAENPLDQSAVHPERYDLVEKMAADLSCTVLDLINQPDYLDKINLSEYVTDDVGLPTLRDILDELKKPGRDPRDTFVSVEFSDEVNEIKDVKKEMILPGIVTNITKFGAFVDIGVHQDGLIHISEMANRFIKDPLDVVSVQQHVKVKVLDVDMNRRRIALSLKDVK